MEKNVKWDGANQHGGTRKPAWWLSQTSMVFITNQRGGFTSTFSF
jgi:hypothetical protein